MNPRRRRHARLRRKERRITATWTFANGSKVRFFGRSKDYTSSTSGLHWYHYILDNAHPTNIL